MARQKNKVCLACNRVFRGRSDARTCSERCRKRLQRAKQTVASEVEQVVDSAVNAVKALENEVTAHATEEGFIAEPTSLATGADTSTSRPAPELPPVPGLIKPLVNKQTPVAPNSVTVPAASVGLASAPVISRAATNPTVEPAQPLAQPAPQIPVAPSPVRLSPQPPVPQPTPITPQTPPESLEGNTGGPSLDSMLHPPGVVYLPSSIEAASGLAPSSPPPLTNSPATPPTPPLPLPETPLSGQTPPPPKAPRFRAPRFRVPGNARAVVALSFIVSLVAIGTYLLGNQQGQKTPVSTNKAGNVVASAESGLSNSNGASSIHLNRDTFIDNGHSFTATGPATFKNQANSAHAFSVQDASGDSLINVDTTTGIVTITTIQGSGALITSLNASALTSGTVSNSRLSSQVTLAGNGFNGAGELVQLDSSGNLPPLNASNLTNLNASQLTFGTVNDARLSTNVTLQGNTFNGPNELVKTNGSGQISSSNLPSDVAHTDVNQTFTGANNFSNADNVFVGDGSGLTSLNASNITSGTLSDNRLTTNVALLNRNNQNFTGSNTFSGATTQTGSYLFQSAANSLNAFQLQNQSGNDNLLIGDTINTRVGIGLPSIYNSGEPQYTLDVGGDLNLVNGVYRINGAVVCSDAGCTPTSGSSSYIQLQTSTPGIAQTGNGNISGTLIAGNLQGNGLGLTNLDASQLATGTVNDVRLSANVTLQGNTFNGANELVKTDNSGFLPALNGSALTNLNASALSSGTVDNNRLNSDVALLDRNNQVFSGNNSFTGTITASVIAAGAGLTIGSTNQTLALQGDSGSSFAIIKNTYTTTIGFTGIPTGTLNYNFDLAATPGTYNICTTAGNCASVGGGVTTDGGTTNAIPKFTGSQTIGNSSITDDGTTVAVNAVLNANTLEQGGQGVVLQNSAFGGDLSGTYNNLTLAKVDGVPLSISTLAGAQFLQYNGTNWVNQSITGDISINSSGVSTIQPGVVTGSKIATGTITDTNIASNAGITYSKLNLGSSIQNSDLSSSLSSSLAYLANSQTFTGNNIFNNAITAPSIVSAGLALGVGSNSVELDLIGNGSTNLAVTTNSHTITVGFAGTATSNITYNFDNTAAAGTYNICTSAGNCAGVGGGVTTAGGTANTIPRFTSSQGIGNSAITDDGTIVTLGEASQVKSSGLTAFQVQNASGAGNALIVDTTDTRVGIGVASPAYPLDVAGNINASTGLYVNGVQVCNASGCGASSATAINNGTTTQINANFNIRSAGTNFVGGVIEGASGQTADLLDVQSYLGGTKYLAVTSSGVTLTGTTAINNAGSSSTSIATGTGTLSLGNTTGATTLAGASGTSSINLGNFTVSTAGAIVGVGVDAGSGLLQGTGGLTLGGTTSVNTSGSSATNIGTNTYSGTVAIGNSSATLTLQGGNSSSIDIGTGTISAGTYNGSGNINTTGGTLQTGSTIRVDNLGNLVNIGTLSLSGSISGGTTYTGSGNINTTGGVYQIGGNTILTSSTLSFKAASSASIDAASGQALNIGTNNATNMLLGNTGNLASFRVQGSNTATYTIGTSIGTGTITLGQSTATNEIDIGSANTTTGNTQTIKIGAGAAAGTGKSAITIGNTNAASSVSINAGNGGIALNGTVTATTIQAGAGLTVGTTSQALVLQGAATSTYLAGYNGSNFTKVTFSGSPAANVTYQFVVNPTGGAGTYNVCTTDNNCSGGAGGLGGSGTSGTIPKFTGTNTLGNSSISDTGSLVTVANPMAVSAASTTAFQIQNTTPDNLFVADTTNHRIAIDQASAGYSLDVNGDINVTSGSAYRINGVSICTSSGCTAAVGSGNYIQNSVAKQSNANFYIESTATGSVTGVLQALSAQTADILDIKDNTAGHNVAVAVGPTGNTTFKDFSGSGSATFFQIQGANFTPNLFTANTSSGQILLPNATTSSTALLLGSVSGNNGNLYASANGTLKTDNNLEVAGSLTVDGSSSLATGTGTVSLNGNTTVAANKSFTANGSALFEDATNSTTAFQIQNSSGSSIFTADTSNQLISVNNLQASGTITLQNGQGAGIQLRTVSNSVPGGATALTFSGNEITDQTRSIATQGDGRQQPDSSTGIWEAATNLVTNGGFESNTTGWSGPGGTGTATRDTSISKFGSASVKLTNTVAGADNRFTLPSISVSANTTYTVSGWVKASGFISAARSNWGILVTDQTGLGVKSTTLNSASNNWVRQTATFTTGSSTTSVNVALLTPQGTVWWDGIQLEQKSIATPYVETAGSQATRNAARVQAPAALINSTQGWFALRVRMGFDYNNSTDHAVFNWRDDATHQLVLQYVAGSTNQWQFARSGGGAGGTASSTAQSFTAGTVQTIVAAWTSTQVMISVNGSAFAAAADTDIPTLAATLFDIGQLSSGNNIFDGDVLWAAAGTGTLSDADAASIYNYGNSDPALISLNSIDNLDSASFRWDGEASQYSSTSGAFTNNSQLSIDDVNLTHTANGSLSLQGGTNSTTAFQVQNASGTAILNVDTSGGAVAITGNETVSGNLTFSGANPTISASTTNTGLTLQANGTGTLVLNTTGAGTVNLGTANTTVIGIGNASSATTIGGTLGVTGNSTLTGNLTANGSALFEDATNSSTAFQIQNSSSQNLFQADTTNMNIVLDGANTGALGAWSTASNSLPVTLQGIATVTADGYVYVLGGQTSEGCGNVVSTVYYAQLNADGSLGSWNTASHSLPAARKDGSAVVYNGYIYYFGGFGSNACGPVQNTVYYAHINSDGSPGTWQTSSNTVGASTQGSVVVNGYVYMIGSYNSGAVQYAQLNADGSTGAFQSTTVLPVSSSYWNAVTANGYIYALGTGTTTIYYAKVNNDGTISSWNTATGKSGHEATSQIVNGYIYQLGGTAGTTSWNAVYYAKLNTDGSIGSWQTNSNFLPDGSLFNSSVAANGYIYVLGGEAHSTLNPTANIYYSSVSRLQIASAVDLVGLTGQTLNGVGSGSSLTAGDITAVGNLQIQGQANFAQGVSIANSLSVAGPTAFQNATNSTTAFQVQNAAGTTILNVDTSGGSVTASSANLYQTIATPVFKGGADATGTNTGSSGVGNSTFNDIANYGKYIYAATAGNATACNATAGNAIGCELQVYDATNPTLPTLVGGMDASGTTTGTSADAINGLSISGHYLYAVKAGSATNCNNAGNHAGCELQVYDISNPANPSYVAGADAGGSTNSGTFSISANSVAISGKYAFVGYGASANACSSTASNTNGCEVKAFDISNPAAPAYLGGADATGATNSGTGNVSVNRVRVTGRYLFAALSGSATDCATASNATGCELQIYDVSSPAVPTFVGGADAGGTNTSSSGTQNLAFNDVAISGRYAYTVENNNATACSSTSGSGVGCELKVWDVSNPALPVYTAGVDSSGSVGSGTTSTAELRITLAGKYAYLGLFGFSGTCSNTSGSNCELQIYDISTPSSPSYLTGMDSSGVQSGLTSVSRSQPIVVGRYLYLAGNGSATDCNTSNNASGCELQIYDISGIDAVSINTGSLYTGQLTVDNRGVFNQGVAISGSLAVGQNVEINGDVGASGAVLFQDATNSATAFQVQNAAGNNFIQVDTATPELYLGNTGIASTIQIGNISGAVAQTINIGNNNTASSTTTLSIGSGIGTSGVTINSGSSGVLVQSGASNNSTTAFQIQDASGVNILQVDTLNHVLTVGGGAQVTYSGGADVTGSTKSGTGNLASNSVYVSGSFAYVVTAGSATACSQTAGSAIGCELQVYNISTLGSPTYVGGADASGATNSGTGNKSFTSVFVSGNFAYVTTAGNATACTQTVTSTVTSGCELMVFDISTPSTPTFVGGADVNGSTNSDTGNQNLSWIYVSGNDAYVTSTGNATACSQTAGSAIGCELQVYDITTPSAPAYIGGADASGATNAGGGNLSFTSVFVSGTNAYVTSSASATACSQTISAIGCELKVFNISTPATPTYIGGADYGGQTNSGTANVSFNSVYVSGNDAYVGGGASNAACSQTPSSTPNGCELKVFDITTPATPTYIGGADASGSTNSGTGNSTGFGKLVVSGNTVYVAHGASAATCSQSAGNASGCELDLFNVTTPSSPTYIAGMDASATANGSVSLAFDNVFVSGSSIYVALNGSATTCSGSANAPDTALGCELAVFSNSGSNTVPAFKVDSGAGLVTVGQNLQANGTGLIQTTTNSTTAFQVQNAAGTTFFNVDTVNGIVGTPATSAASTNSQAFILQTGNATGTTSNSGNLTIDSGTATGTAGTINIGTANSPTINIGSVGSTNKNTTIHIGDSSAGVQTITIGSTSSSSAVTINAGTGGVLLSSNNATAGITADGAFNYCAASGTNTLTCTITPAISAYRTGMVIFMKNTTVSSAAVTLNVNSLGAKQIWKSSAGAQISDNSLKAGGGYVLIYDGTEFMAVGL